MLGLTMLNNSIGDSVRVVAGYHYGVGAMYYLVIDRFGLCTPSNFTVRIIFRRTYYLYVLSVKCFSAIIMCNY